MRRRFSRGVRRSNANLTWARLLMTAPNSLSPNSKELVLSIANPVGGLETTIVRTRGVFGIMPGDEDLLPNPANSAQGAFGIGVFATEAWAVGTTAVPGPYSDPEWDGWMLWQPWILNRGRITPASGDNDVYVPPFQRELDVKSMRKLDPGYTLGLVIESSASSVLSPEYWFGMSFLTKLRGTR